MSDNTQHIKHGTFTKHLWIVGFGAIACGTIPLLFRHFNITKEQITVVAKDADPSGCAAEYGLTFKLLKLTVDNFKDILNLQEGDTLLNLSIDVGSIDLMKFCSDRNALYVDTSCEPWDGGYFDSNLTISQRSLYWSRTESLEVREHQKKVGKTPTVITSHGANPGIVSHFVKVALLNIAKDTGHNLPQKPKTREEWANLAKDLNIKVIHIAERDTQTATIPRKRLELQSTWSVEGFAAEFIQPAELSWGTHEKHFPHDGHKHDFGDTAIYLDNQSHSIRVRTWAPLYGPFTGFCVPHNEAISIAEYLTVKNEKGEATYRPTCHFSYHPCDAGILSLHELAGKNYDYEQFSYKLLNYTNVLQGADELGVLLAGHKKNAYWWGSTLNFDQAKKISPYNSATTLQVVSGVIGGLAYALKNPNQGYLEVEDMDHEQVMEVITPLLGDCVGAYTDWTPLVDRGKFFDDHYTDNTDPWQFKNVRYH